MTADDIDRIRELEAKATPGPWTAVTTGVRGGDHWYVCDEGESIAHISANDGINEDQRQPDAEFIAAARTAVPALLSALDDRDARIAELEAELAPHREEVERQKRWAAYCRQSDVRCLTCDLRYEEREQYRCEYAKGGAHRYDETELAEALAGNEEKQ